MSLLFVFSLVGAHLVGDFFPKMNKFLHIQWYNTCIFQAITDATCLFTSNHPKKNALEPEILTRKYRWDFSSSKNGKMVCVLHPSSTTFPNPPFLTTLFRYVICQQNQTGTGRALKQPTTRRPSLSLSVGPWEMNFWSLADSDQVLYWKPSGWFVSLHLGRCMFKHLLGGGGGLKYVLFFFIPKIGEDDPIWLIFFSGGWNHQLETHWFPLMRRVIKPLFLMVWMLGWG